MVAADSGCARHGRPQPASPALHVSDTVYLVDTAFEITSIGLFDVQLIVGTLYPPFSGQESRQFEQLCKKDLRNGSITEFLSADLSKANDDLREVLTSRPVLNQDKAYISGWLRSGEGNKRISQRLSETFAGRIETMGLSSAVTWLTFPLPPPAWRWNTGKYIAKLGISWDETARLLRALYQQELDPSLSPDKAPGTHAHLEGVPTYRWSDPVKLPFTQTGRSPAPSRKLYRGYGCPRDTGPYSWNPTEPSIKSSLRTAASGRTQRQLLFTGTGKR